MAATHIAAHPSIQGARLMIWQTKELAVNGMPRKRLKPVRSRA
jgi:hypothetical protein